MMEPAAYLLAQKVDAIRSLKDLRSLREQQKFSVPPTTNNRYHQQQRLRFKILAENKPIIDMTSSTTT